MTTLPFNYVYGLSVVNSHLWAGGTLLLTDRSLVQKEFWAFFHRARPTSLAGVPYTYELLKRLRFLQMETPGLATLTQAGGKLNPELHREFAEYALSRGKKFVVMYGAAEATARMAYLPPEKALEKCGSMGRPIAGGRFTLEDEHGVEIFENGPTGELVYYGDNVTLGYAESGADLARGDERRGRLATGDLARRDEEGYYYVTGRKNRFLKIFGHRLGLDETEQLLKTRFPHLECACLGRDDRLRVFAAGDVQGEGFDFQAEAIKNFLVETTRLNPSAFEVALVPEIPKNEAGKTLYAKLEADHAP
jgi:acyl-coenzyme A synthetase/AMP-(fatty) acid ligase